MAIESLEVVNHMAQIYTLHEEMLPHTVLSEICTFFPGAVSMACKCYTVLTGLKK